MLNFDLLAVMASMMGCCCRRFTGQVLSSTVREDDRIRDIKWSSVRPERGVKSGGRKKSGPHVLNRDDHKILRYLFSYN